jgi:bacteriocin-like protein
MKEDIAMKTDTKNPNPAPQKEDPTIKKDDELREDELKELSEEDLSKVAGGGWDIGPGTKI